MWGTTTSAIALCSKLGQVSCELLLREPHIGLCVSHHRYLCPAVSSDRESVLPGSSLPGQPLYVNYALA